MKDLNQRIIDAQQEAEDAFWDVVGTHFPEITTGDCDPIVAGSFAETMRIMIHYWYTINEKGVGDEGR